MMRQGPLAGGREARSPASRAARSRPATMRNSMAAADQTEPKVGLRERKKRRTGEAIVRVAHALFAEQGYRETTLLQVAEAAEVAPSTLQRYFQAKSDIVFAHHDVHAESARRYIQMRPEGESTAEAIVSWVTNTLPEIESPYANAFRDGPRIIAQDPDLQIEQRLRYARLEDIFAESFARDLNEPSNSVAACALGTIAFRALNGIWETWLEQHVDDPASKPFVPGEVLAPHIEYVRQLLDAALAAVSTLPRLTS
jgi:AcrR family transcriptional regulator